MTTDTKALRERLREDAESLSRIWGKPREEYLEWQAADAIDRLEAERDAVVHDAKAVRELMNVYNLGGWTDAERLQRERDELRARLARMEAALVAADAMRYCTEPLCKNCWPNYDRARAATKEDGAA